jgi:hypothetical protein
MNDGLRTDIFLRYRAETIACACIFLAARTVENPVSLPNIPRPWFELYDSSEQDVRSIASILTKLYTMPKVPDFAKLNAHVEKLFKGKIHLEYEYKCPILAKYEVAKPEPPKEEIKTDNKRKKERDRSHDRSRR